jgi:hypothetical protein
VALARVATPTSSPTPLITATSTGVPTPWASVPKGTINLRSGPGSAFPTIGELAQGARVRVTGRREDGAWLRVCCTADGREGWASAPLLQVGGALDQAEIVKLPTATVTRARPTATRARPSATRAPTDTATPEPTVCVQGRVLNVAGGQGIADWLVRLVDSSGIEKASRTDPSGSYRFSELPVGAATITVDLASGWRTVSPLPARAVVAPSDGCVIVDIWAERAPSDSGPGPTPTSTPIR